MEDLKDRILGSMIGGAVGDALGYPVEFMGYRQIQARYGPAGITRYDLDSRGVAEISDDTQMTLYTANGLLIGDIKTAYLEWFITQMQRPGAQPEAKCWVSQVPEMYSPRAPGNTCMSALRTMMCGHEPNNHSKGCGGIMRVAPIALWAYARSIAIGDAVSQACQAARLTHQHPLGFLSAGLFVAVLYQILAASQQPTPEALMGYVSGGLDVLSGIKDPDGTPYGQQYRDDLEALRAGSSDAALRAAQAEGTDLTNIESLGQGWTAEEAWYISLYCALRHTRSFEDAVVAAVNHGGDSDSTGAITGNIMGAILGFDAIPAHYKAHLELSDIIHTMASDLCHATLSR